MPSEKAHLEAFRKHIVVLDYLRRDVQLCSEWIAVVAFYAAVHLVEAIFAKSDFHSSDHRTRLGRLKSDKKYKCLFHPFRHLKTASEIARYLGVGGGDSQAYQCFSDYMTPQDVESTLVKGHLATICRESKKFLSGESIPEIR